ncbi:hypothetical protein [Shimazuella kribbensis]|uniref:hypothetical protein n=1 Tax=Shimazuella kribbensis TaxID=139808 RepID=UPI00048DB28E|nr:hypothetical protein [Shimazuella kribbensis]
MSENLYIGCSRYCHHKNEKYGVYHEINYWKIIYNNFYSFATAVMLESEDFLTPNGVSIPLGRFTAEEVHGYFTRLPVHFQMYLVETKGIRPGYTGIALVVGRLKK